MASAVEIITELRQQLKDNLPGHRLVLHKNPGEVECQGGRRVRVVNTEVKIEPDDYKAAGFIQSQTDFPEEVFEVKNKKLGTSAMGFRTRNMNNAFTAVEKACDNAGCGNGENCVLIRQK